jgi:dihydrofolate reductase
MTKQIKHYPNMGLIVAMSQDRAIGHKNELIYRIREDLEFFKKITMDSYIIMGRSTYESMPKSLSRRKYIVLSKNEEFNLKPPKIVHRSLEETLEFVSKEKESTFWVIGGGIIYSKFLPHVSTMHITKINSTYPNADTFFPEFNQDEWIENTGEELYCQENDVSYKHVLYLRK